MPYILAHSINGKTTQTTGNQLLPLFNPAVGEVIGQVPIANQIDIEAASHAALNAFPAWSKTPAHKRAQVLFRFKALVDQHLDELAEHITREHGKTLSEAKGSILRGIELIELGCNIADKMKGFYAENIATNIDGYSFRQPIGVCLGITPFNFPAMIPLWMLTTAIACGNTFILKPSEKDPSCSSRLIELLYEAGLPLGVVNVLHGDHTTVDALLKHPNIDAVSFVGSTPVAKHVYETAILHGKRAQAFGGAKNHGVVMPDAQLDYTVKSIVGAAYGCAGERCMALPVVLAIGDHVADALIKALIPAIQKLKVGSGTQPNTDIGPLISAEHCEKVKNRIQIGIDEGATLIIDGRSQSKTGFFCGPCLFDHVTPNMKIYQEEIFGPVLCVVRVESLEQAITLINHNPYGNGTAIFTRDGETARSFVSAIQVGMVGVNIPVPVPAAIFPFGGWKQSKFGDSYLHGDEGLRFYTKTKSITQYWPARN